MRPEGLKTIPELKSRDGRARMNQQAKKKKEKKSIDRWKHGFGSGCGLNARPAVSEVLDVPSVLCLLLVVAVTAW